jgi:hypothetical protein
MVPCSSQSLIQAFRPRPWSSRMPEDRYLPEQQRRPHLLECSTTQTHCLRSPPAHSLPSPPRSNPIQSTPIASTSDSLEMRLGRGNRSIAIDHCAFEPSTSTSTSTPSVSLLIPFRAFSPPGKFRRVRKPSESPYLGLTSHGDEQPLALLGGGLVMGSGASGSQVSDYPHGHDRGEALGNRR